MNILMILTLLLVWVIPLVGICYFVAWVSVKSCLWAMDKYDEDKYK